MSKPALLDASALLALLGNELGATEVRRVLPSAAVSTINLAEVYSKLADEGNAARQEFDVILQSTIEIIPFTSKLADLTGSLRPLTRHLGLSLGDRACLALGIALNAEVYTADQNWAKLDLPCHIHLIR